MYLRGWVSHLIMWCLRQRFVELGTSESSPFHSLLDFLLIENKLGAILHVHGLMNFAIFTYFHDSKKQTHASC